jgi:DNA-binding NtrC family response regulator
MPEPTRILVLDDESSVREPLCRALASASCQEPIQVRAAGTAEELLEAIEKGGKSWDLAVVDLHLGRGREDGIDVLRKIKAVARDLPVVIVSDRATLEDASRAFREGATDFVERGGGDLSDKLILEVRKVRSLVAIAEENRRLRERNAKLSERARALEEDLGAPFVDVVGQDPVFLGVLDVVRRVAPIPRSVLVLGERGTGKELIARALHTASPRRDGPFVPVNCAAFEENVLASELFGHERGAFTGADRRRIGRFERADGGTLFLDEIGHMSVEFQKKILRVLEYPRFERVGGESQIQVDVRVVAATNRDLPAAIREGTFLSDLFDRLAFEVVKVPPLRERRSDIAPLARHFMTLFLREVPSLGRKELSGSAVAALEAYDFPGNVRELKNIIERAVYRDTTSVIDPEDLLLHRSGEPQGASPGSGLGYREQVKVLETRLVREALASCGGNSRQAADRLGLTYDQLKHIKRRLAVR